MSELSWRPSADIAALRLRARLNQAIRQFFAERDVLEVETPMLSAFGTTDRHIESFATVADHAGTRWLRTSPEFALKRLLAAGVGDCYELGRVFRRGEAGRRHNPEFTLLEWYRIGWDLPQLIGEVEQLVAAALALVGRSLRCHRIAYRDLFRDRLVIDPLTATDADLFSRLPALGVDPRGLDRDDALDLLFTHALQPTFDSTELLSIHDYPASQCALARIHEVEGHAVAARFEAYLGPQELCNGYHELIDAEEQSARFAADRAWREANRRGGPMADAHLLAAMRHGLPACAGVAVGVDRLLTCLLESATISEVIAFAADRA